MAEDGVVKKEKPASSAKDFLAEVLGEEALAGKLLSPSAILELMDLVAGRIAFAFAEGPCTTVSFDRVDILVPICHGDLVRVEGQVVLVGSSSITIHVEAKKHDFNLRKFKTVAYSYITYVAIDPKTLRPNKNIPTLKVENENEMKMMESAKRRKELSVRWVAAQKAAASEGAMPTASALAETEKGLSRREYLTVNETEVVVRKQMLPRHNNHLNIIFGGDVLRWMLGVAQVTAKRFTGNTHMIVISMNRIDFRQTIKPEHVVEMHARVVSVRNTTIEVEIEAFVDKIMDGLGIVTSHSGYFTVLNVDEIGFRRPVQVGLNHTDDDQDALQRCAKAIARRDFDERIEVSRDVKSDKFFLEGFPVSGS
ncbi:hypothetical protein NDN08_006671 [Rhodosorus marinus]|uniref:HotDog ACOT-type domain-containing protein n=1 Tax=Rhodosorus marinus TaxID=101924 RepID=A0AAV8UI83_9RHOD|nr:hypothetical protein NDN08_006671 [Rhodosorus marinus]